MKLKKLSLIASLGILTLGIASCGGSSSSSKNSTTPYGNLDLNATVATATDNVTGQTFSVSNQVYYDKLRFNGYDILNNKLNEVIYKNEIAALKAVFDNDNVNDYISNTEESVRNLIIPIKNDVKLFELTGTELLSLNDLGGSYLDGSKDGSVINTLTINNNYDYIRRNVIETITQKVSSLVLSSSSSDDVEEMEQKDINTNIEKFIDDQKSTGYVFTTSDLEYEYAINDRDVITFKSIHTDKFSEIVSEQIRYLAVNLSSQNAVYQIADEEYYTEYNADEETKNDTYYIFDEDKLESTYENTAYNHGTYNIVYISFNSRKEAIDQIKELKALGYDLGKIKSDYENKTITEDEYKAQATEAYLKLYNSYYNYKTVDNFDGDDFVYNVNYDIDELSDIASSVKTLVTEDLESGDFLTEPRNINSKYIMAYHISTEYEIHDEDGEQVKYDDLLKGNYTYNGTLVPEASTDDTTSQAAKIKNEIDIKLKYNALLNSALSYTSTNFRSILYKATESDTKDDDLYIYDPILEYKFNNNYEDDYDLITSKDYTASEGKYIFKFGNDVYTVEDFYMDATERYGVSIINDILAYEYAYQYKDDYVDEDDRDDYIDSLDDAISKFKKGNDDTYPKYLGVENFLLLKYGYSNKENIIKYANDASTCYSQFLSDNVYKGWVTQNEDGTYSLQSGLDTQTSGILYNLLQLGNSKYADLLTINLSHILINIDDDADGSPDDPQVFLKDMSAEKITDFYNSVTELAKALYNEAEYLYNEYSDNTYVEILKYIKTKYEQGADLEYNSSISWDDFKKYNFLLTVEDLSDIDESSVNNFVETFKKYVQNLYKAIINDGTIEENYDDGKFIIYNETFSGLVTDESQIFVTYDETTKETDSSLCASSFGYHLLILNSYDTQDYLTYSKDSVKTDVGEVSVLIYEDEDDKTNNINVTVEAYNETSNATFATWNQFFIYYCQKIKGESNSLSSDIYELMGDLFLDVVNKYISGDFQKYLLLKYIDVNASDNTTVSKDTIQTMLDGTLEKLGKTIYDYDTESDYYSWISDETLDWLRPCQTKKSS
ncbi:MAG: hypothetical protein K6E20_06350 [Acholeplasmatales bacterium]|nr:hypothetical protein [Acholeplasmatales bacterium]